MRELLTVKNDPKGILRTPCKPVRTFGVKAESIAKDLADFMYDRRGDKIAPVGLSAPQLGEPTRIIVFYPNPSFRERIGIEVLVNPELVKTRDFILLGETCLSVPGKTYSVRRARSVKVKGFTLDGRPKSYKTTGILAQVLQHEINHLDGVLIDKVGRLVRG